FTAFDLVQGFPEGRLEVLRGEFGLLHNFSSFELPCSRFHWRAGFRNLMPGSGLRCEFPSQGCGTPKNRRTPSSLGTGGHKTSSTLDILAACNIRRGVTCASYVRRPPSLDRRYAESRPPSLL